MAKSYAQWGGIVLLVLGIIGIFVQPRFVGLNTEWIETAIHIVAGGLLAYAGFRGTEAQAVSWSRIFGIVFLVVGIVGFFSPRIFGILRNDLGTLDNIVHLAYGVVGFWAARGSKMA